MAVPSTRDVVRGYYDAWTSRDLGRARGYLADDLEFQGSLRRFSRADDFIPALEQFLQILEDVRLLKELYEGDDAMMLYDCMTGRAGTIRTAEAFTVRDGKIRDIKLVFDPTELNKLGRQPA
jgi:ketosteroid isomerase-like protein